MNILVVLVPVIVALITAGIPAWVAVHKWRHENAQQHAQNLDKLTHHNALLERVHLDVHEMKHDVKQVRSDLDRHLGEHDAQQTYKRLRG